MAKPNRPSQPSGARARLAAEQQRAAAAAHRRRTILIGGGVAAVVLAIVGIMAFVALNSPKPGRPGASPAPGAAYVPALLSVPPATLDAVGAGSITRTPATPVTNGKPALVDGKPRILYVGAEFCPYCALERWPLVIALSRFGTFEGLEASLSSPDEGPASNIPSVTFKDAKYTSQYIAFNGYETADRFGKPLQQLPAADATVMQQYTKNIPFQYWGTGTQIGASFADYKLLAGKSGADVAAKLSDPASPEARVILGAANAHTARICGLTGGQPENVCTDPGVKAAAGVAG